MTLSRAAETPNVSERLQQQKEYLIVLANREALIESDEMDQEVLKELVTQVNRIMAKSKKTLQNLIAKINDATNEASIEDIESQIKGTLQALTQEEETNINQAYFNSMAFVQTSRRLATEGLTTSENATRPDTAHEEQPPTETPTTPETNTSHHFATVFTNAKAAAAKKAEEAKLAATKLAAMASEEAGKMLPKQATVTVTLDITETEQLPPAAKAAKEKFTKGTKEKPFALPVEYVNEKNGVANFTGQTFRAKGKPNRKIASIEDAPKKPSQNKVN